MRPYFQQMGAGINRAGLAGPIPGGGGAGLPGILRNDIMVGSDSRPYGSYGGGSSSFGSNSCFSIDICPDLIIAAVAAAAAAGVYLIYTAIVAKGKRRRRKRSLSEGEDEGDGGILEDFEDNWPLINVLTDHILLG